MLLLVLLAANFIQSQSFDRDFTWLEEDNAGIKQITISKDGKPGVVQYFDRNGNPYFIKNTEFNGDDVIAAWYLHYDKPKHCDKIVFAHSNIGFEIYDYSNVKNGIETYTYFTKEAEDFEKMGSADTVVGVDDANTFAYTGELKKISDTTSLLHSRGYLELLKRKKYLLYRTTLDAQGREIGETTYKHNKKIEAKSTTQYFPRKTISEYINKPMGIKSTTIKTYSENKNLMAEDDGYESTKYHYSNGKVVEKQVFRDSIPVSKTTYGYENGLLVTEILENLESHRKYTNRYQYNDKRKLAAKIIDTDNGKKTYTYEYVYW